MEKKIEDYAPLYIGCEVQLEWMGDIETHELFGVIGHFAALSYQIDEDDEESFDSVDYSVNMRKAKDFKLLLRPLSSMTEEEQGKMLSNHGVSLMQSHGDIIMNSETTRYLLSQSFDLFGLIDSGLALDKTKL